MKIFKTGITGQLLKEIFTSDMPATKIVKGLPEDAELVHTIYEHKSRQLMLYWTSELAGEEIPEGASIESAPYLVIVRVRQ